MINTVKSWFTGKRSLETMDPITSESLQSELGIGGSVTNVTVSHNTAIGYAPLFQAVNMISGDVAKLPISIIQKTPRGRKILDSHPVHSLISRNGMANHEVSSYKFMRRFVAIALLWGNSYAYIDRSNKGKVLGFYQLLPDRTFLERKNGVLQCVTETSKGLRYFDAADCLHIEGLCIDNVSAADVVMCFREDFQIALSSKRFTSKFFANNMTAGGILQAPPGASAAAVKKVQGKIQAKFSGSDDAFKTIVLRDGFKWFETQIDPSKAELTNTNEEGARNVARMFNMSPSRLGLKDSTSYNSEEQATRNYYDGALSHWLLSVSTEITTKALTDQERSAGIYAEHNVNALLWADAKTRSDIANAGISNGRYTPNETRAWENLDGYVGGDQFYTPLNMQTVNATGTRTAIVQASKSLLQEAFTRAINRICIKAERTKANPVEEDRQALLAIVGGCAQNVSNIVGREGHSKAMRWLDSVSYLGVEGLREKAEELAAETIRAITEGE